MRLGVTPWRGGRTAAELTAQARQAESWGYDAFWLPENHFNAGAIPEPLMLLAAVAAGTENIRLATTSLLLPLRHPLQAAEQVAVLDQLSGGRVILGVGRGFAPHMLRAFGVVPRDKRRLFEASLERMFLAWSGAPVIAAVDDVPAMALDPLPVQRPHPPVWVAAFGPKALTQAGRLGLPYLASPVESLETLGDNYAAHRQALAAAGKPLPDAVPVMRSLFVTENARETAELRRALAAQAVASRAITPPARVEDWCIVGEAGYVRDRVDAYRAHLGMTHLIVARLRLGGIDPARADRAMARAAELLGR
jgi:alkanesulfonate monooxygenase SsuD/methylene tetrahydromethanopterin reductase-like flavin-dependent oxidoreductase (luciferase family)